MILPDNFGYRLKRMRQEQGFKQAELSRASGISRSRISELENHPPEDIRLSTLRKLAHAYRMKLAVFIECLEEHEGMPKPYYQTFLNQRNNNEISPSPTMMSQGNPRKPSKMPSDFTKSKFRRG